MDATDAFLEDVCQLADMLDDWELKPKDYYDKFSSMCLKYLESSIVPYSLCREMILEGYPCEEYYMQMLMEVYSFYNVGDDFLEVLQAVIDEFEYSGIFPNEMIGKSIHAPFLKKISLIDNVKVFIKSLLRKYL